MDSNIRNSLIITSETGKLYVRQDQKLAEILQFILHQAKRLVSAVGGAFYLVDETGKLQRYGSPKHLTISDSIARHAFKQRKNLLLKKNAKFKSSGEVLPESYMACFLGQDTGFFDLGVFILEEINHFENFSKQDFELISYYCSNLSLLLRDSGLSDDREDVLTSLLTSVLLLVDNSNIHQKNNRLEYQLEEIIRVSGLINSSLELGKLLESIMQSAKAVFRTEGSSLMLVDPTKEFLYFQVVTGDKKDQIQKIRVPMGQGIAGTVAITKQPMIINDAIRDPRVFREVDEASNFVTRNILAAPLVVEDEVIGIIEAINTIDRNHFTQADLELFLSFATSCALAIQKTRLLENLESTNINLQEKVRTLGSLFELGQAVMESHTESDLLRHANSIISTEMESSIVATLLVDRKKLTIDVTALVEGREEEMKEDFIRDSIVVESIIYNRTVVSIEGLKDGVVDPLDLEFVKGSHILLPLSTSGEKPFGVICISGKKTNGPFDETHLRLLKTISSQIIKGYENLKLNQEMIAKKAIEKEIEITRNIQQNILPTVGSSNSNFDLGVKSVAAKEVSGDFFDIHKYDDGQFSYLVADVSGKSLPAAIFMAISSSIIRTLARNHLLSPDEILTQANTLIYEDSQSGMFVTLFYIHYDPVTMEIQYASAGHNDQIWIKNDNTYELLKGKGAPLGVVPLGNYKGGRIKVAPGELFVIYTDGAIEEKNGEDEEFGLERFIQEIISRKHLKAQEIIEDLYNLIVEYAEGAEQFDDFTVMILKFDDDYQFQRIFPANTQQVPKIREFVGDSLRGRKIDEMIIDDILLSIDEAATNIILHGYKGSDRKNQTVECSLFLSENLCRLRLVDYGNEFLRQEVKPPSVEANLRGERKGGFGVYLMEKLMDKVSYKRDADSNVLVLEKNLN
ncbi:SpoIIE family protein phosphatase [Leptospira sp. GIMC2001]|uniref:SpoIIE family protein phosphatase n=1 Tax=Leptospira sp. GIMC2001 TaxID=1513297 RepID=UPI002349BDAE|nr:SpoIIE family protein phosphatase [Leptospira sp. GIMC2001]WCL47842.1 SpoIIE family protein phosphatase [Leptospira sp. GIMC2001]